MHFPKIRTTRTSEEQANKVVDEFKELEETGFEDDEEVIDILHAAETLVRVHFEGRENIFEELVKRVITKNRKRGYYDEECY